MMEINLNEDDSNYAHNNNPKYLERQQYPDLNLSNLNNN